MGSMGSCASMHARKHAKRLPMVLAVEVANATNAKTDIMGRLALKNVRLAARHASWWMVLSLMGIAQENSCQQVIAPQSARTIITGTDV